MSPLNKHPRRRFGEDFSASPNPVKPAGLTARHVLVVGGGVAGLTTSWILLDQGYKVTVVSQDWATYTKAQRLTSQISGALWEFPSAPCGPRISANNVDRIRNWALDSYDVYYDLATDPDLANRYGVQLRKNLSCFPVPIKMHDVEYERVQAIEKAGIPGFRHDANLIQEYDNSGYGAADAFEHISPVIDTDQAMSFLMEIVESKGAKLVAGVVKGDLWEHESEIRAKYDADIIVNTSGLGARELASDPNVHAGRGGLLRVVNDGSQFAKIEHAMVVNTPDPEDYNIVFIVPRNDNTLILGTFIEMDEEAYELKLDSPAMIEMREKCERFVPQLKNARLDPEYDMAQGLRPLRKGDVRVQRESRVKNDQPSQVIHAYGHGIGGWSLAFGSAFEVLSLVESV